MTSLMICFGVKEAYSEFSSNDMVSYLTGIPHLKGSRKFDPERPAVFIPTGRYFTEYYTSFQEVYRSFETKKQLNHFDSVLNFGGRISGRSGYFLSLRRRSNQGFLEFMDSKLDISQDHGPVDGSITLYSSGEYSRTGITLGKSETAGNFLSAQSIIKRSWGNLHMRYSEMPHNWAFKINFRESSELFPADFRRHTLEAGGNYRFNTAVIGLQFHTGTISTPEDFRGQGLSHAQVWDMERNGWKGGLEVPWRHYLFRLNYEDETYEGWGELFFNARPNPYFKGFLSAGMEKLSLETYWGKRSFSYIRAITEGSIKKGQANTSPFTPPQLAIIGDKAWMFTGTGKLASNTISITESFGRNESSSLTLSYTRLHPSYDLRIRTWNFLSPNPWEIVFGRLRIEKCPYKSQDIVTLAYSGTKALSNARLDWGASQMIPFRKRTVDIETGEPSEDKYPSFKFELPDAVGGFKFWTSLSFEL